MRLTNKQRIFVEKYLQCWNGAEAARAAGYALPYQSAYDNLRKPYIKAYIEKRLTGEAMSANEVLARLAEEARADLADFFTVTEDGQLRLDWEKAQGKTHLIKAIRFTLNGINIEVYSAQAALDKLARAHGIFTERIDVTSLGRSLVSDERNRLLAAIARKVEAIDSPAAAGIREEPD